MIQKFRFPEQYIVVGTVTKAQGLTGEVAIHPSSGQPENFYDYRKVVLVDDKGTLSPVLAVTKMRIQKGKVIAMFDRVPDRTFAEKLVGMAVLLDRNDLPELDSSEYYWHELTGLRVVTVDGKYLGTVTSMFSNGAQDIMVVSDGEEYLIPMTDQIVKSRSSKEMVIQPPPGLLEINSDSETAAPTDDI